VGEVALARRHGHRPAALQGRHLDRAATTRRPHATTTA